MSESLTKTAVITGGSRGIGLHTARRFALNGWNVGICGRNSSDINNAKDEIENTFKVKVFCSTADVASVPDMKRFARQAGQYFGNIDTLICNAAVLGPVGHISSIDLSAIEKTLSVNILGLYNSIQAFWPFLSRSPSARILLVSGGGLGGPNQIQRASAYVPSKAALGLLAEILADDLRSINGAIIAVAPGGVIPTDFLKSVITAGIEAAGESLFNDAIRQQEEQMGMSLGDYSSLVDFLMTEDGIALNGRLLSAKWNQVNDLKKEIQQGLNSDTYRLRRIDNQLYKSIQ